MRVLLVTTDYEPFLQDHYSARPDLRTAPYQDQLEARYASWFSGGDSISIRLMAAGHEAIDIFANNRWMQEAWLRHTAAQHGTAVTLSRRAAVGAALRSRTPQRIKDHAARFPRLQRKQASWIYEVLGAQVDHYQPDVVINQSMDFLDHDFFKALKPKIRAVVGLHSAVGLPRVDLSDYDLMIASFPPTAAAAAKAGAKAVFVRLAFDPRVLDAVPTRPYDDRDIEVAFIGSFGQLHKGRTRLLEMVCERFPGLRIWGPNIDDLPAQSCLRKRYVAPSWGSGMYETLGRARIVVNGHGDIPAYAANSRMYEATGCGALLVTDWKPDLEEVFSQGTEVLAYRDDAECLDLIDAALAETSRAKSVAIAGKRRTLKDHTYDLRVPQMMAAIEAVL